MYKKLIKSEKSIQYCSRTHEYYLECDNPFIIENVKLWDLKPKKSISEIPNLLENNLEMLKYWINGFIYGKTS